MMQTRLTGLLGIEAPIVLADGGKFNDVRPLVVGVHGRTVLEPSAA